MPTNITLYNICCVLMSFFEESSMACFSRRAHLCDFLADEWVTTESVFLLHRRPKTQLKGRPNAQNPLSQKKSGQGGRVPLFRKKSCRTTQKHNAHTDLGGDFLFFFCCHLFKKVHKHNTNAKAQIKKMINVVTQWAVLIDFFFGEVFFLTHAIEKRTQKRIDFWKSMMHEASL